MSKTIVRNLRLEPVTLPAPFNTMIPPGVGRVVGLTEAMTLAMLGGEQTIAGILSLSAGPSSAIVDIFQSARGVPYLEVTNFLYCSAAGSDTSGDGSLLNPYRWPTRALEDIPTGVIPAGTTWRIVATGCGTQTLPEGYAFPVFVAADGIGKFDFAQPFWHYYSPVNIQADYQLATVEADTPYTPLVGSMTITSGTASITKASTGLKRITRTDGGTAWVAGALKGKICVGAGLATNHSVVWDNGVDWIEITRTGTPTFPIRIMEHTYKMRARKNASLIHEGAINLLNTPISLLGIEVESTGEDVGNFGQWGLAVAGSAPTVSFQGCTLRGLGILTNVWTRLRQCYVPDLLFAMAPLLLVNCYVRRSFEVVPSGPRTTVWGSFGTSEGSLFRQCVIEGTTPFHYRDLFDNFNSGFVALTQFQNVQILDTIQEPLLFPAPVGAEGAIDDGIFFTGGRLDLMNVDISRTALGPGSALKVKGNGAFVSLRAVTGTNYALGCEVIDGGNVELHDAATTTPTTLTGGALSDQAFKSGSLPVQATWMAPVYPDAGSNFPDCEFVAGPPYSSAQLTRVWRRST